MSFSIHLFIFLDSLICSFNAPFIVPGTDLGAKNRKSTKIPAFQEFALIQKDRQIKYVNTLHGVLEDAEEDDNNPVKSLPAMQETWVWSLGWEDPLEKEMATHCSILAGKSHGQGSLAGDSPWGRKELDTT